MVDLCLVAKFRKFWAICFSGSYSISSPCGTQRTLMLDLLLSSHKSQRLSSCPSIFFFFLNCSDWMFSIDLTSSSRIPSYFISFLLSNPSSEVFNFVFIYCIFHFKNFIWFFVFLFYCSVGLFLHLFQEHL